MDLDHALIQALAQYGKLRRGIQRRITQEAVGVPFFAPRDALQWIGRLERPNVTMLAEALGITRGGASKAVAKLLDSNLVERYQLPENRKEVYYRLTEDGALRLKQLHTALAALTERELSFIRTLPDAQKQAVLDFLAGYVAHLQTIHLPPEGGKEESVCERP